MKKHVSMAQAWKTKKMPCDIHGYGRKNKNRKQVNESKNGSRQEIEVRTCHLQWKMKG